MHFYAYQALKSAQLLHQGLLDKNVYEALRRFAMQKRDMHSADHGYICEKQCRKL